MKSLSLVLSASLLAATVSAQCFESDFGVPIPRGANTPGVGDDVLFDVQPLNLTFPMGGVAASYDSIHVQSNGVCFLTNALATSGATTTGYSGTASTMVTNLRGTATQPPRISAYWRDLNILASNGAGVYINNTIPGKCVVTWANAVHFGQTAPVFTLQAQLFADGSVSFFYDGATQNTATTPICGVSQGAAVADPGASDLSAGAVGTSTTLIAYETFATSNTFDLQTTSVTFAPNAIGGYDIASAPCVPASISAYGNGCYDYQSATQAVYQQWLDAAASSVLAGQSMTFTPAAQGYTLAWGGGSYVVPSGAATTLTLADDAETDLVPSIPFPHVDGPVATLSVCSNGYVNMAPSPSGNGTTTYGSTGTFLGAAAASFRSNSDYDPSAGGAVKAEELVVGSDTILYVTWEDVERFSDGANPERFQFQFNLTTGVVTLVWDAMTTLGSRDLLVGYAPVGPSLNGGSIDLATALPITTQPDASLTAMSLAASPAPISTPSTGTTITYTTSNIPEAGPGTGLYVSTTILSFGQDAAGTDLAAIGAPGCSTYLTSNDLFLSVMFGGPTDSTLLDLPAGLPAGFTFYAQSIALVIPNSLPGGFNDVGLLTSNGLAHFVAGF
ncbi:MAG: hypothetical protein R3F29_08835 [Planctomycetota bacterium]